jgi:hypothetical protein
VLLSVSGSAGIPTFVGDVVDREAWYDSLHDRLVVAVASGHPDRTRLVRHEGSHELCARFGIFGDYEAAPLWLQEGLAQYCEASPFGSVDPDRQKILQASSGKLIPWEQLLAPSSIGDLPSSVSPTVYYAQSWYLCRWLMVPERRPHFFKYISTLKERPNDAHSIVAIMNAVGATASQLGEDLQQFAAASSEPPHPSP